MAAGVPSGSVVPVHARDFGKYQLVVKLATGGMAEIFLARPKSDKAPSPFVVIKRILPHLDEDDQFVAMFLDEARIAARITHPNVCQVYELGEVEGQYFLSLEYLEGITLNSAMRKLAARKQNIDVRLAVAVLAQAAEGLHHAHDLSDLDGPLNIVHRDVSPQNLLVTVEGLSKVLDFGIAKAHGASSRTRTGTVKGKYAYMPPEQLRGDPLDRRTDVWALGVVLFEALTGKRLFWRETDFLIFRAITDEAIPRLRDYRPDAPKELDEAIAKAISRPREERFASAREFAQAITASVAGTGGTMPAAEVGAEIMRLFGDEILAHRELVAEGIKQSESPQLVSNLTPAKGTAIASPPPPPSSPTSPPTVPANPRAGSQPGSPSSSGRYARPHSSTAVLDDGRDTVDEGPPRPTRKPKASPLPGGTLPLPAPEVSTIAPSSVTGAPPVGAISDPVAALPTPSVPVPPVMPARVPRPSDGYPALKPNNRGYLWVVAACLVAAVGIAVALTRSEPTARPLAGQEPMPAMAPPSIDASAVEVVQKSSPDAGQAVAPREVAPPDAAVQTAVAPKEPREPKERETKEPRRPRDKERDREAAEREREREREKQRDREAAKDPVPAGPPGWISLDSDPYATIFVDGRKVGVTPLARIALPPGPHKVRAISARGEQTFSITIESGKESRGRKLTW